MDEHQHQIEVRKIVWGVLEDCSHCHHPHSLEDFRVVGRNGNLWVLTIHCSACESQAFVAAVVGDQGADIAEAEAGDDVFESVADEPSPVTVDDVLDMHEFLDAFDGDFFSLFARNRR